VSGQARDSACCSSQLPPAVSHLEILGPVWCPMVVDQTIHRNVEVIELVTSTETQDINFQRGSSTSIRHSVAVIPASSQAGLIHSLCFPNPADRRLNSQKSTTRASGQGWNPPCRGIAGCTTGLPNTTVYRLGLIFPSAFQLL
jgi:hypothetical protein